METALIFILAKKLLSDTNKKKYIAPDTILVNVEIERIVATSKYDEIIVNPNYNGIPV